MSNLTKRYTKRYLIVIGLLSFTVLATLGAYSTKDYSGELYTQNIPIVVGDWYGNDYSMDERTYEILETKDAIMRKYVNQDGEGVLLTLVFSQNNRKIAHPPEVCFAGSGWERTERDIRSITAGDREIKLNRLMLQRKSEKQVVLYLYKCGDKFISNYYRQQFNIILNGILHKDTSSALIRISSIVGSSEEKTMAITEKFTGEIIPILGVLLP
jgi:EpsI family protein